MNRRERRQQERADYSIEQVWGGPCDHHNCKGDCVAFVHPIVTEGETWQIARASDGWGISLAPLTRVEVA